MSASVYISTVRSCTCRDRECAIVKRKLFASIHKRWPVRTGLCDYSNNIQEKNTDYCTDNLPIAEEKHSKGPHTYMTP